MTTILKINNFSIVFISLFFMFSCTDKMDFNHMTSFMNKMIPALEGMINAPEKEIKMN